MTQPAHKPTPTKTGAKPKMPNRATSARPIPAEGQKREKPASAEVCTREAVLSSAMTRVANTSPITVDQGSARERLISGVWV
jgi:hypothetical protein